jgi:tetratricopeptide (TPR) repeat protein
MPTRYIAAIVFILGLSASAWPQDTPAGQGVAIIVSVDSDPTIKLSNWRQGLATRHALSTLGFPEEAVFHLHSGSEPRSDRNGPATGPALERLLLQLGWTLSSRDRVYLFLFTGATFEYGAATVQLADAPVFTDDLARQFARLDVRDRVLFFQCPAARLSVPVLRTHEITTVALDGPFRSEPTPFVLRWLEETSRDSTFAETLLAMNETHQLTASVPKGRRLNSIRLHPGSWPEHRRESLRELAAEFEGGPDMLPEVAEKHLVSLIKEATDLPGIGRRYAYWLRAHDRPDDAATLIEAWLKDHGDDISARELLAISLLESGVGARAAKEADRILVEHPESALALAVRALTVTHPTEEELLNRALLTRPTLLEVRYLRSRIRADHDDPDGAETDLAQIRGLFPGYESWLYQQAEAARRRPPEAIPHLTRLLTLYPNHADGWALKGSIEYDAGQVENAAESARRAVTLDPSNERARSLLLKLGLESND